MCIRDRDLSSEADELLPFVENKAKILKYVYETLNYVIEAKWSHALFLLYLFHTRLKK